MSDFATPILNDTILIISVDKESGEVDKYNKS